jgi:methylated-DNA-protein-cysteine methyltransferase-like protein
MNKQLDSSFAERVYAVVVQIPEGRVMTYGQIAGIAGSARAGRIVGGIAHYGPSDLPWHRVVNKKGGLASGYHGGRHAQKEHLEAEGVIVFGEEGSYNVDVSELLWSPELKDREMLNGK